MKPLDRLAAGVDDRICLPDGSSAYLLSEGGWGPLGNARAVLTKLASPTHPRKWARCRVDTKSAWLFAHELSQTRILIWMGRPIFGRRHDSNARKLPCPTRHMFAGTLAGISRSRDGRIARSTRTVRILMETTLITRKKQSRKSLRAVKDNNETTDKERDRRLRRGAKART